MEELAVGMAILFKELYERAEEMGISRKVLWLVKDKLGVVARKEGYQGSWVWSMPNKTVPKDSQINIGTFEESLI